MKRILAAAALVALSSTVSFATGIVNSKHDLSKDSSATIKSAGGTQICIFCHTPHNAVRNIPLWNRSGGTAASTFKLYTASATLGFAGGSKSALAADSISVLCLNCHDGSVTQLGSRVVNKANGTYDTSGKTWTTKDGITGSDTVGKARLGSDLTNDHPIGFAYPATAGEITTDHDRLYVASAVVDNFNASSPVAKSATVFFKSSLGSYQMECSSCHMVHDPANSFFLRATNTGSKLCLSCHKK